MQRHTQILGILLVVLAVPSLSAPRVPTRGEMERVQELAFQIEIDTDDAYVEAVRAARAGDEDEEEALRRLYTLKESASYFRDQIKASYKAPAHTAVSFERLNNDFIESRDSFSDLRAHREYRELFETIEDTIGNLRFYYVSPDEYDRYADHDVYPYYPGVEVFVHVHTPTAAFYFRHGPYWHLHPEYSVRFAYRVNYRYGFGRYGDHYRDATPHSWHRKNPPKVKKQTQKPKKGRH